MSCLPTMELFTKNSTRHGEDEPSPDRITVMQSEGLLTDMKLVCQHETFFAHKLIVATSSAYMQDIFKFEQGSGRSESMFTVLMHSVKPVDVSNILKYIYTGEVRVRSSEYDGFLQAAELLRVDKIPPVRNPKEDLSKSDVRTKQQATLASNQKKVKKLTKAGGKGENQKPVRQGLPICLPKKKPTKPEPFESSSDYFKKPKAKPLGKSAKTNVNAITNQFASLAIAAEKAKPRVVSSQPKIDTNNTTRKENVFYITPLVKKLQLTTPESQCTRPIKLDYKNESKAFSSIDGM